MTTCLVCKVEAEDIVEHIRAAHPEPPPTPFAVEPKPQMTGTLLEDDDGKPFPDDVQRAFMNRYGMAMNAAMRREAALAERTRAAERERDAVLLAMACVVRGHGYVEIDEKTMVSTDRHKLVREPHSPVRPHITTFRYVE